jgi:hypothetical protein
MKIKKINALLIRYAVLCAKLDFRLTHDDDGYARRIPEGEKTSELFRVKTHDQRLIAVVYRKTYRVLGIKHAVQEPDFA